MGTNVEARIVQDPTDRRSAKIARTLVPVGERAGEDTLLNGPARPAAIPNGLVGRCGPVAVDVALTPRLPPDA